MNTTIVYAHPWSGSFNQAVLKAVQTRFPQATTIDLYRDGFDPVMREAELALFSKGQSLDPLVKEYQALLLRTERLIFVFPIWWYGMPALLKGFFDKVMLKKFAYIEGQTGLLVGQLTHINEAVLLTTSQSPNWYLRFFSGNPIGRTIAKRVFKDIGIKKVKWLNAGKIATNKSKRRARFIEKICSL